jgi:hypothetical protein
MRDQQQRGHRIALLAAAAAAIWVAGAAAVIAAAPMAAAQSDDPACSDVGNATECQSPGNVEINATPPAVDYAPQYPYWEGDSIFGVPGGDIGSSEHR